MNMLPESHIDTMEPAVTKFSEIVGI